MLTEGRSKPRRKFSQAYITAWAALGTCAFTYLTLSTVAPELVGEVVPIAQRDGGDEARRLVAEVNTLRNTISTLQRTLDSVRRETGDGTTRAELAQRLAMLEEKLATSQGAQVASAQPAAPIVTSPATSASTVTGATSAAPPPTAAVKPELSPRIIAKAAERAQKAAPPIAQVATAPTAPLAGAPVNAVPPPNPILLNAAPPEQLPVETSQITTGSVPSEAVETVPRAAAQRPSAPPAPPAAAAPKIPTVRGPVGIELADADSVEALRLNWSVLNDQNGSTLSHLSPRYKLSTDNNAQPLTLVAGPVASAEEAVRICSGLKARGVRCKVGGFAGERL